MGMFEGKKGLILGVANDRSIAWAIAQVIMKEGGVCGFNHLPDKPDDERQRNRRRVTQLTDQYKDQVPFVLPLDVQKDDDIAAFIGRTKEEFGQIDFLLHSIAFATLDDLKKDTIATSREGFKLAMEIFEESKKFPKEETYSLTDQIRKASRSVATNIGEGYRAKAIPICL